MATIAFFVDFEEGHLFPTFGLSTSLKERGHVIHYIGMLDIQQYVEEQGFEFHPILQNQFPLGFRERFRKQHINKENYSKFTFVDCLENELPVLIEKIQPQALLMSTYLSLEALFIYYRYKIKPVIFMPVINSLTSNECLYEFGSLHGRQYEIFEKYRKFNAVLKNKRRPLFDRLFNRKRKAVHHHDFLELISPVESFEQLIACSAAFELPDSKRNAHYVGPCLRNKTGASQAIVQELKSKNKKIIFVSLGSQTERIHNVCDSLYRKIIALMCDPDMAAYHVILSTRTVEQLQQSISIPENVTLVKWVDSLDILEIASVLITHGGLGLVKEGIYHGVPMIILPDKYDQPLNAERVVYHQLGVQDSLVSVTKEQLKAHLLQMATDSKMKEQVQRMKDIFRKEVELQEGAKLVERICNLQEAQPILLAH